MRLSILSQQSNCYILALFPILELQKSATFRLQLLYHIYFFIAIFIFFEEELAKIYPCFFSIFCKIMRNSFTHKLFKVKIVFIYFLVLVLENPSNVAISFYKNMSVFFYCFYDFCHIYSLHVLQVSPLLAYRQKYFVHIQTILSIFHKFICRIPVSVNSF